MLVHEHSVSPVAYRRLFHLHVGSDYGRLTVSILSSFVFLLYSMYWIYGKRSEAWMVVDGKTILAGFTVGSDGRIGNLVSNSDHSNRIKVGRLLHRAFRTVCIQRQRVDAVTSHRGIKSLLLNNGFQEQPWPNANWIDRASRRLRSSDRNDASWYLRTSA